MTSELTTESHQCRWKPWFQSPPVTIEI